MAVADKVKSIIVEQLGVDEEEVTSAIVADSMRRQRSGSATPGSALARTKPSVLRSRGATIVAVL